MMNNDIQLNYNIDNYISLCDNYIFVEKFIMHEQETVLKHNLKSKEEIKEFIKKLYKEKSRLN